jgi:hypothetical protein
MLFCGSKRMKSSYIEYWQSSEFTLTFIPTRDIWFSHISFSKIFPFSSFIYCAISTFSSCKMFPKSCIFNFLRSFLSRWSVLKVYGSNQKAIFSLTQSGFWDICQLVQWRSTTFLRNMSPPSSGLKTKSRKKSAQSKQQTGSFFHENAA